MKFKKIIKISIVLLSLTMFSCSSNVPIVKKDTSERQKHSAEKAYKDLENSVKSY